MKQQPRYLVMGGAGFIGLHLTRISLRHGCAARTLDAAQNLELGRIPVDVRQEDFRDPVPVSRAMEAVEVFMHCAAATSAVSLSELESVNAEITRLLLHHRTAAEESIPWRC